jgi:membrane dipeptidase
MRKILITLLIILLIGAASVFALPSLLDRKMNSVESPAPYPASEPAKQLHQQLFIADLHDDVLLWERDLLKRYDFGHSDLPRMLEGRVGLQVFSTVTKTPRGINYERNAADSDNITLLAMAQRWPRATWNSLLQRALYQAQKLNEASASAALSAPGSKTRSALLGSSPPKACTRSKANWKTSTHSMMPASA